MMLAVVVNVVALDHCGKETVAVSNDASVTAGVTLTARNFKDKSVFGFAFEIGHQSGTHIVLRASSETRSTTGLDGSGAAFSWSLTH